MFIWMLIYPVSLGRSTPQTACLAVAVSSRNAAPKHGPPVGKWRSDHGEMAFRWFTHWKWRFSNSLCKRLPEGIPRFVWGNGKWTIEIGDQTWLARNLHSVRGLSIAMFDLQRVGCLTRRWILWFMVLVPSCNQRWQWKITYEWGF